jgi:hypothetical protein
MEYQWLPERLKLNGAICLELMGSEEVNEFLISGGKQLAGLRQAMNADAILRELSQTPLMLSIMSLAYEGVGEDDLAKQKTGSPEERREQIFNLYVERMFQRKDIINSPFRMDEVIDWLTWLAKGMKKHSQSVFMIEELQPSWLRTNRQRETYGGIIGLIVAFIFGLSGGLSGGLIYGWKVGLSSGMIVGLISAMFCGGGVESLKVIIPVETLRWQWDHFWSNRIKGLKIGLKIGLIVGLIIGLIHGLTIGGVIDMLIGGLHFAMSYALMGCLIGGLISVVLGTTISGLLGGMTYTVRVDKVSPNQGIILSLKNAVLSMLIFGFSVGLINGLITGLIVSLIFDLINGLIIGLIVALVFGLIGALNHGGSAVVKHYSLRFILLFKGYTPFQFIEFLDHCAKLILLKKVGGGYMFIHRMLLEHFAKMEIKSAKTKMSK